MEIDQETKDDYADVMSQFGLTPKVEAAPEEVFYLHMTSGESPRADMAKHWLQHEMGHYDFMLEEGVKVTVKRLEAGVVADRPVTRTEFGRMMMKYYLYMNHFLKFSEGYQDGPRLDIDKTLDLFMEYQPLKKVIVATKN